MHQWYTGSDWREGIKGPHIYIHYFIQINFPTTPLIYSNIPRITSLSVYHSQDIHPQWHWLIRWKSLKVVNSMTTSVKGVYDLLSEHYLLEVPRKVELSNLLRDTTSWQTDPHHNIVIADAHPLPCTTITNHNFTDYYYTLQLTSPH